MQSTPGYLTVNSIGEITESKVSSDLVKFPLWRKIQDYISFDEFLSVLCELKSSKSIQRTVLINTNTDVFKAKTTWRNTKKNQKIVYIEDLCKFHENSLLPEMPIYTDYDSMIYNFLSQGLVKLDSSGNCFNAVCKTKFVAQSLARYAKLLLSTGYQGVRIDIEGEEHPYLLKRGVKMPATAIQVVSSGSCKYLGNDANMNVFNMLEGTLKVYDISTSDYILKAVKPDITEGRLNKPIAETINKPLGVIDSEIGDRFKFHLDRLKKTGLNQVFNYTHFWDSIEWHFTVTIAHLVGFSEALSATKDSQDDLERYVAQRKYWLDKVNVISQ